MRKKCFGILLKKRRFCRNEAKFLYCGHHWKQPFLFLIAIATVIIFTTDLFESLGLKKPVEYLGWSKEEATPEPTFKDTSLTNILILPFVNPNEKSPKDCIPSTIEHKLNRSRDLIEAVYLKGSILDNDLERLIKTHDADFVIHGFVNNITDNCDSLNFCLKYAFRSNISQKPIIESGDCNNLIKGSYENFLNQDWEFTKIDEFINMYKYVFQFDKVATDMKLINLLKSDKTLDKESKRITCELIATNLAVENNAEGCNYFISEMSDSVEFCSYAYYSAFKESKRTDNDSLKLFNLLMFLNKTLQDSLLDQYLCQIMVDDVFVFFETMPDTLKGHISNHQRLLLNSQYDGMSQLEALTSFFKVILEVPTRIDKPHGSKEEEYYCKILRLGFHFQEQLKIEVFTEIMYCDLYELATEISNDCNSYIKKLNNFFIEMSDIDEFIEQNTIDNI